MAASCSLGAAFACIQGHLLDPLEAFATEGSTALSQSLGPVVTAGACLYVALMFARLMLGIGDQPVSEFYKFAMRWLAVSILALNIGTYTTYVAEPFSKSLPSAISGALLKQPDITVNTFDGMNDLIVKWNVQGARGMSAWSPGVALMIGLYQVLLLVCAYPFMVLAFFLYAYTKMMMLFVLALGPLFFACALFETTKPYVSHFVSQLVTLLVQQVLITAVVGAMFVPLQQMLSAPPTAFAAWFTQTVNLCVMFCFFVVVMYQIPALASRLGGAGHAAGTHALGSWFSNRALGSSADGTAPMLDANGNILQPGSGGNGTPRPARTETAGTAPRHHEFTGNRTESALSEASHAVASAALAVPLAAAGSAPSSARAESADAASDPFEAALARGRESGSITPGDMVVSAASSFPHEATPMSAVGDAPSGRLTKASTPDVAGIREAVITTDGGVSLSSGDTRDAPATTAVSFIAETIATEGTVLPEAGTQTRAADTTTSSRSLDAQTAGAPAAADAVTKQTS